MLLWVDEDGDEITVHMYGDRGTIILEQGKNFKGEPIGAAVLLPKSGTDDAASFIKALAEQLQIEVEIAAPRTPTDSCVTITQPDDVESGWTVSGQITDGMNMRECLAAMRWILPEDYDSINYMVERMLRAYEPIIEQSDFGSESSCFFAYPNDRQGALNVAGLINSKVWIDAGGFGT